MKLPNSSTARVSAPSRETAARAAGFTLIELMVTIVIGAILLSIAVPTYMTEIRKSRRTDARNAVLDLAAREERFMSVSNIYSQVTTDLGYTGNFPQTIGSGYYTINVTVTAASPTATPPVLAGYTVTATAIGSQVNDTACASFSVTQTGQQSALNSGGTDSTSTCWNN